MKPRAFPPISDAEHKPTGSWFVRLVAAFRLAAENWRLRKDEGVREDFWLDDLSKIAGEEERQG